MTEESSVTYRKKLIEVALPLKAINEASAAEKKIHVGTTSNIHAWWARRPLAACRAVLFASLVDDPSNDFPAEEANKKRNALFDILRSLVQWESNNDRTLISTVRSLITQSTGLDEVVVVDPFCGSGTIPIEAQRLGIRTLGCDLNPIAVAISKALVEVPPAVSGHRSLHPQSHRALLGEDANEPFAGFRDDLRYYSSRVLDRVRQKVGALYSSESNRHRPTTIAWLWCRTVPCTNPACGVRVPLIKSLWLSQVPKDRSWLSIEGIGNNGKAFFGVQQGAIGEPDDAPMTDTGARCVSCPTTVTFAEIRDAAMRGRLGFQMVAVASKMGTSMRFRPATADEERLALDCVAPWTPDTPLPEAALGFRVQNYGFTHHRDLFLTRQLAMLSMFADALSETVSEIRSVAGPDTRYANALAVYLAIFFDRLVQTNNALVRWFTHTQRPSKAQPTFDKQTVQMIWDFAEVNPLSDSAGGWSTCCKYPQTALDCLSQFPSECREADYERRLKMAYPIHPELFDRLYNDWSTLDKFQRTRGVLRLMATVIHSLWERQDSNLLIMPATIPVDDQVVHFELTRYLDDQWAPVIDKDVDGPNSLPLSLDRDNPNLGRYSACRRVSRTIYMGSAPIQRAANRGIDDRQVKLGCVQPGEAVATFGDALRRLTDRATYLYIDGKRYWYSTQPTVTRLADDRATQLSDDDVEDEIQRRLRDQARSRGDFAKVHACVPSGDIPDEREARLVILGPAFQHAARDADSPARKETAAILESRGTSPRNYKNTLVFLASDANRLRELEQAVRQYLAWSSICVDRETLNLDQFQTRQAETKRKTADETVDARIPETFQWLLVPGQPDPKGSIVWNEYKLQGSDSLAVRAAKKLKNEAQLHVALGGVSLRHELDKIPLWRGDHVGLKQLCEDMARYLYLPRIRDDDVLLSAVQDGIERLTWQSETFAYAESWDQQRGRYEGLRAGTSARVIVDGNSLLVKPDIAAAQMAAAQAASAAPTSAAGNGSSSPTDAATVALGPNRIATPVAGPTTATPAVQLRRFHGSVHIDPIRLGRDASRIAEEVIQHLSGIVGANVEITLEIHCELAEGASEKLVRDVTENCRTLRFTDYGFEEA